MKNGIYSLLLFVFRGANSLPKAARFIIYLIIILSGTAAVVTSHKTGDLTDKIAHVEYSSPAVLGETTSQPTGLFSINIPSVFNGTSNFKDDSTFDGTTTFNGDVKFKNTKLDLGAGQIFASNILYQMTAGNGISVTNGQNPTITNTGVTSLQGSTGAITLTAGSGITINGTTISSSANTSQPNTFGTMAISGTSVSAGSTTDTFTFTAGSGITLGLNTSTKTLTISGSNAGATAWTDNGTYTYLTTSSESVGIGTSNPVAKLDVQGSLNVTGTTRLNGVTYTWPASDGSNGYLLSTNASGGLSWVSNSGSTNYWQLVAGSLSSAQITNDLLVGATSTSSALAKFSGTTGGNSFINTGNVGIGSTSPSFKLDVNGDINIASGSTLKIAGTTVLSGNTLGSGITSSSLTSLGTITSGTWQGTRIGAAYGGTGIDTSSSTGIPTLSSGTWSISSLLSTTLGGTGLGSYTAGDILYYSSGSTLSKLGIGSTGQCLTVSGSAPSWGSCGSNFWQLANGVVSPFSSTLDFTIGGTSTSSAKFAILNVNNGTPTASISASNGNNSAFLSGAGVLGTTNKQTLTLGNSSTGNILLQPQGTTIGGVNATGLGLGTNNPSYLLQVVGDTDGQAVGPLVVQSSTSGSSIGTALTLSSVPAGGHSWSFLSTGPGASAGAGKFAFYDGTANGGSGAYRALIDTNGNFIINATTASNAIPLTVNGAMGSYAGYGPTTYLGGIVNSLQIGAGGSTPNAASVAWGDGSGWKLNFGYVNGSATFVPKITFVDTGNLGIGTSNPTNIIDVLGATTAIARFASSGSNNALVSIDNVSGGQQSTVQFLDAGSTKFQIGKQTNNTFFLYDGVHSKDVITTSTGGDLFLQPVSGTVSIGTTSVSKKLVVSASGNADGILVDGSTNPALSLANNGTIKTYLGVSTSTDSWVAGSSVNDTIIRSEGNNILFTTDSGSNVLLSLKANNGNVGIGTSTPLAKLHVAGDAPGKALVIFNSTSSNQDIFTASSSGTTRFKIANTGNVTIIGTPTTCTLGDGAGSTTCSSDIRLKQNITDLSDSLDKIMALRPVTFNWKKAPERNNIGFIAQEVQPLFPEMVRTLPDGYLGLDYANLVVPAIKAIQEQQAQINTLTATLGASTQSTTSASLAALNITVNTVKLDVEDLKRKAIAGKTEIDGLAITLNEQETTLASHGAKLSELAENEGNQNTAIASISSRLEKLGAYNFISANASTSGDIVTVKEGLLVLGTATLNEESVATNITVGNNLTIEPNTINTLSGDLDIQSLRQGAISFMAGAVRIETDGTVKFMENVAFEKDVSVAGVLGAKSINLTRDMYTDLTDTESLASASAGTTTITSGKTKRILRNNLIKTDSLIYVTPMGKTFGETPYVSDQKDGQITITIDNAVTSQIKLNFLIINTHDNSASDSARLTFNP